MKKSLISLLYIVSAVNCISQTSEFDSIKQFPTYDGNKQFVKHINMQAEKISKSGSDSIALIYTVESESNFAILISKSKNKSQTIAFYQIPSTNKKVKSKVLTDSIQNSTSVMEIYKAVSNNSIREVDSNGFNSNNNPVYCKIYLNHEEYFLRGYQNRFNGLMNIEFNKAYVHEEREIYFKAMKKIKVIKMPQQ